MNSAREQIARIIDPEGWADRDREGDSYPAHWLSDSLAKADAILAARPAIEGDTARDGVARLASPRQCPPGWVLVPAAPTEAMIEAYCNKITSCGWQSWVNLSTLWPVVLAAVQAPLGEASRAAGGREPPNPSEGKTVERSPNASARPSRAVSDDLEAGSER